MLQSERSYSSCQTDWHHISMCDYHQEYTGCFVSHHMHQNVVKVVGAASAVDDDGNQESACLVVRNTCRDGDDDDCSCRPNSTLMAINSFKIQLQRTLSCDGSNNRYRNTSGCLRTRKGSIAVVEVVDRPFLTSRTCVGVYRSSRRGGKHELGELGLCDGYGTIGTNQNAGTGKLAGVERTVRRREVVRGRLELL